MPSRKRPPTDPPTASKPTTGATPKRRQLSRTHKPAELTLEEWQVALRREFAQDQDFHLKNLAGRTVFSDFAVGNPKTKQSYRVAIRGEGLGVNYCACPDYATNTLGTCKHIEFVLARLREKPSAAKVLTRGYQPPFSEVYLRYGDQRQVVFAPARRAPAKLRELAAGYFDEAGLLRDDALLRFDGFLDAARRLNHEVRCYDDALDFLAERRDAEHRWQLIDARYGDGGEALDGLLKTKLYPYQKEGVLFAAKAGRALLGDEMGLGKTVQALAFAELMAREFGVERVLIVCPASLKYQWKQEVGKFTDRDATVIEGLLHQRRALYATDTFFKIVNYDVIRRDLPAIAKLSPDVVILDEAQRIKNWETITAAHVKRIESPYALVLTGTPLENRLEELYSIAQFVDRHRLGPLFRLRANHQVLDSESGKVVGYRDLNSLGETLKPVLLRRRKAGVQLQLPTRTDNNYFVPMTGPQRDIHEENNEIVAKLVRKWRHHKFLSESDQRRLTIALLRMRMSCDSTYLVDHETRHGHKVGELTTLLGELLQEDGGKVVVFSEWQRMHELLLPELESRGWAYEYLHGGVPSKKRRDLLTRFRENPDIRVFLATEAGGVGLNLQTAATVVNLDLPWNPARLEQRIGRVHRLGQRRNVRVVNFVSEGTIEHGMLDVLRFKSDLFAGVLDGGKDEVFLGGTRLTKFMETVESVAGAIPETSPEQPADEEPEPAPPAAPSPTPPPPTAGERQPAPTPTPSPAEALAPVLTAGAQLLKALGDFVETNRQPGKSLAESFTETDPETGRTYLKVPLPEPEVVAGLAAVVGPLLALFGGSVQSAADRE